MNTTSPMKWMTRFTIVAALALTLGVLLARSGHAGSMTLSTSEIDSLFAQAKQAYDENRLQDSVTAYRAIVDAGYVAPELYFNLGNALFRSGQVGEAVLHYRKAWYLAPADPDIEANMRFALQHTGASPPAFSLRARIAHRLSKSQWLHMALGAYWAGAFLLACWGWSRSRHGLLMRGSAACGIVALVALGGWMHWVALDYRPEFVIVGPGQKALFAPLEGSTEHFAVPEGSIVRATDRSEGWLKIGSGDKQGWVRASACRQVLSASESDS